MSSVSAVNTLLGSTSSTTASTVDISSILAAAVGATTPGIDVTAAVAAAIYADRAPERIWQSDQTTLTSQTTALTAIQAATVALTTDMTSMNSLAGPLSARDVTSSNPNVVTATAASGTATGNHTIAVGNLAVTASWYSDLSSSATAPLPSSTFTITNAAGSSATISTGVGTTDTLSDLANAITASTDRSGKSLGVTASVVSDVSGSRLAIISNLSGAQNNFSITSDSTSTSSWTSASVATSSTALGADSFVVTTGTAGGSTAATITVTAGETFDQLASAINAQVPSVTASVVTDKNGAHLQIVSGDGTTPFSVSEPGFAYTQAFAGIDASLTVDGAPITSSSNNVAGAIPGVTLALTGTVAATTPINLTISADATQITTAVNQFVTDYNKAVGLVNAQFNYDVTTGSEGVLGSDPTVRALQQSLMQAITYISPAAIGTTTIPDISALGITQATDGTLTLDSATLSSALINNAGDVADFLQGSALNGFASSMTNGLSSYTDAGNGAFTVDLSSISSSNTTLTTEISDFESLYIENQQTILTAMYSAAEIALQQLPTEMAQIQAELGNGSTSNGG